MSEMVRKTGKITPFEFSTDNLNIYEMLQELKSAGVDIDESDSIEYDSITGEGVVVVDGVVYVVENLVSLNPDDGYACVIPNEDGSFDFDTVYYTGSSFLEEQLEEAFGDIDLIHISEENMNARDIVFEYMKLNTQFPIEIIKELGKDEVYQIIKQLDWHI